MMQNDSFFSEKENRRAQMTPDSVFPQNRASFIKGIP